MIDEAGAKSAVAGPGALGPGAAQRHAEDGCRLVPGRLDAAGGARSRRRTDEVVAWPAMPGRQCVFRV